MIYPVCIVQCASLVDLSAMISSVSSVQCAIVLCRCVKHSHDIQCARTTCNVKCAVCFPGTNWCLGQDAGSSHSSVHTNHLDLRRSHCWMERAVLCRKKHCVSQRGVWREETLVTVGVQCEEEQIVHCVPEKEVQLYLLVLYLT